VLHFNHLPLCVLLYHAGTPNPFEPSNPLTKHFTYLFTFLLIYLLAPWGTVLLEKLTSFQLVKKFPGFCETRRFITAITSAHHLSLSWAS